LPIAVQEATARLGLVTGKGLAALIRERFPRWILLLAVGLVTIANTFNIGADIGSMAAATQLLIPVPWFPLVVAFTVAMAFLEVAISLQQVLTCAPLVVLVDCVVPRRVALHQGVVGTSCV